MEQSSFPGSTGEHAYLKWMGLNLDFFLLLWYSPFRYGGIAQLVEHTAHIRQVIGSSPIAANKPERDFLSGFFFEKKQK